MVESIPIGIILWVGLVGECCLDRGKWWMLAWKHGPERTEMSYKRFKFNPKDMSGEIKRLPNDGSNYFEESAESFFQRMSVLEREYDEHYQLYQQDPLCKAISFEEYVDMRNKDMIYSLQLN